MGQLQGYINEQPAIEEINLNITKTRLPTKSNYDLTKKDNQVTVGFYVSCQQGLAFTHQNLNELVN